MMSASFGIEIASMRGSVGEIIVGLQMECGRTDGRTDGRLFSFIYIDFCLEYCMVLVAVAHERSEGATKGLRVFKFRRLLGVCI